MYTKEEIIKISHNMTLNQLVFFYNEVFGDNGYFTYLERAPDTETGDKQYYIWQDGDTRNLNKIETRIFILRHMTVQNLKLIEESTFNGAKWLSYVCNITLKYV